MKVELGGKRVGSGAEMEVELNEYGRSTHDLSYIWRSTMAPGTLVPFINEVLNPGDTFEIDLDADCLTHPTIGPLFGSFKLQFDVYKVPIRLYQAALHMNMQKIGLKMDEIYLPQVRMEGRRLYRDEPVEGKQISPSCIHAYLGTRALGQAQNPEDTTITRGWNAIPYLAYWDIYKQYYSNKQEEIGYVIHNDVTERPAEINNFEILQAGGSATTIQPYNGTWIANNIPSSNVTELAIEFDAGELPELERIRMYVEFPYQDRQLLPITELWSNVYYDGQNIFAKGWLSSDAGSFTSVGYKYDQSPQGNTRPNLVEFPLSHIDDMRLEILQASITTPFVVTNISLPPYSLSLRNTIIDDKFYSSAESKMEGLGIKTYQSDLFNNWLNKDWVTDINEKSSVQVTDNFFTLDEFALKRRIWNMLNRVSVSDGTYQSWVKVTYGEEDFMNVDTPIYMGGLSKELVFQEVISNSATTDEPLGTLAGRGRVNGKHKGGKVRITDKESCVIIGIASITPRIDYSQGNKWSINLQTMDDFHKPIMDGIGFQNLMEENLNGYTAKSTGAPSTVSQVVGKQPAWINYQTNVNQTYGNFALPYEQMYMTLNRKYENVFNDFDRIEIGDLTTYIDPSKYNNIFADTRIDAQNFWMQIKVDMEVRRKMSAKVIPNL